MVIFGVASRNFLFQNIMEGLSGSETLTEAQEKAKLENEKQAANIKTITDTLNAITSDYNIAGVSNSDNGIVKGCMNMSYTIRDNLFNFFSTCH